MVQGFGWRNQKVWRKSKKQDGGKFDTKIFRSFQVEFYYKFEKFPTKMVQTTRQWFAKVIKKTEKNVVSKKSEESQSKDGCKFDRNPPDKQGYIVVSKWKKNSLDRYSTKKMAKNLTVKTNLHFGNCK